MAVVTLSALLCVWHKKNPIMLHINYDSVWANTATFCGLKLGAGDRGSAGQGTSHFPSQQTHLSDAVL